MSVLVIDIGTTGVRAAVMHPDAVLDDVCYRRVPPSTPFPGLVEFDAVELSTVALELAHEALARHGASVAAVGVTTQRASTIVWDRATGTPVGPGLGWQDLRTVVACITAKAEHGFALAPNQSATKVAALLDQHDPDRTRDLCFGTVDTWMAWVLTGGREHVTDRSNAAVTGMLLADASDWNDAVLDALRIPRRMLPRLVDTSGPIAPATALPGAPVLASLVGDQQGSLVGQSCVRPGDVKITFGTGGMLDMCVGPDDATGRRSANRNAHGTFPIVAWGRGDTTVWGVEGIMLSAGTNIEWLRDDLQLIDTPDFPAAYKEGAEGARQALNLLREERELDWVFLSPPALLKPGPRTGRYQVGAEQLLMAGAAPASISDQDLAAAIVDELEQPRHHRQRFTVATAA